MKFEPDFDSENAVGATFSLKIREGRSVNEYAGEITAYERPRVLGSRLSGSIGATEMEYRVTPEGDGTLVEFFGVMQFETWHSKALGFLFGWFAWRIGRNQLKKLKQIAESG